MSAVQMDPAGLQAMADRLGLVARFILAPIDDQVRSAARAVDGGYDLARAAGQLAALHVEVQEQIRRTSQQAGTELARRALQVTDTDSANTQVLRLPRAGR